MMNDDFGHVSLKVSLALKMIDLPAYSPRLHDWYL
jgi:hypothetical protein